MKSEIQKFFKGEVEDGEEVLKQYSRDASIFEIKPKLVLFPLDSEDVKNLVKWVSQNKEKYKDIAITARCAGTCMSGGSIGESIILDFTRHMNKLINFCPESKSITVQPGMFYRDFEKITLAEGLVLPCYTAAKNINAMGGMFGNNSAGEKSLKYGQTNDYILETKVVFADGNEYFVGMLSMCELREKINTENFESRIYKNISELINNHKQEIENAKPKVSKNSAGYYIWNVLRFSRSACGILNHTAIPTKETNHDYSFDLNQLLVGSQGTLGIITEITFKLVPRAKYARLVVVSLNSLDRLGELVDKILELKPDTLETYDDQTVKLAGKFFGDFLKNKNIIGKIKFLWHFLPEFKMMLKNDFPKLTLLVKFDGTDKSELEQSCLELKGKIQDFKVKVHFSKSESESNKYWDIRRESFNLLRKHTQGRHTAPFIEDIIVRPEFLPEFLPELNKILNKYNLLYTIAGHAGNGNFHIIPLMDFSRPDINKIIMELSEEVFSLVVKYQGSLAAEHNDGIIRTPFLNKMYNQKMLDIFLNIKNIFDSSNIFNPGKKVISSDVTIYNCKEYITSRIATDHKASHSC